jgi:hypothetical protein
VASAAHFVKMRYLILKSIDPCDLLYGIGFRLNMMRKTSAAFEFDRVAAVQLVVIGQCTKITHDAGPRRMPEALMLSFTL